MQPQMPPMPDNAFYMRVAYVVASIVYFGYVLLLWRRNVSLKARAERLGMTGASTGDEPSAGR